MKKIILIAAAMVAIPCSYAVQIAPVSYLIDQTPDGGTFSYQDSGGELTDGVFAGWPISSQMLADPWVGFTDPLVNIDFTFDDSYHFNEVKVDTMQRGIGNIPLPTIHVYSSADGSTWSLLNSIDNSPEDGTRNGFHLLSLPLQAESEFLRVALEFAEDGPWTFISEVQFFGDIPRTPGQNVPDGGATVALLGLSFLGLGILKRKRN